MKHLLLFYLLFYHLYSYSQYYIDMTYELSNVKENLIIDGNTLKSEHRTREEIIITGKNLVLNDNSGIILNNVILLLNGSVQIKDGARVFPKLIDSYIICKNSDQWESKFIVTKSNFESVELRKVKHIKKIKGNPNITILDASGKIVYKGPKDELNNKKLPIARYDLKVEGRSYESKLLFS